MATSNNCQIYIIQNYIIFIFPVWTLQDLPKDLLNLFVFPRSVTNH